MKIYINHSVVGLLVKTSNSSKPIGLDFNRAVEYKFQEPIEYDNGYWFYQICDLNNMDDIKEKAINFSRIDKAELIFNDEDEKDVECYAINLNELRIK